MFFICHHPGNFAELFKIAPFLSVQRISLEKRYHFYKQVLSISYYIHKRFIPFALGVIGFYITTTKSLLNGFQNFFLMPVLVDVKFWNSLPTDSHIFVFLKCHVEATFSIDKTRNIVIIHSYP